MPQPSVPGLRAALATAAATLALAAPASADPVLAGPAVPDELAVLAVGGALANPASLQTDQVALHRLSTASGAYRGRIVFPAAADGAITAPTTSPNGQLRNGALDRSVDGRYLTFVGINSPAGVFYQEAAKSTAVRVAADGTWADTPLGTGFVTVIGESWVGAVTVDGSRYWTGANARRPVGTIAPGDAAVTQVAAPLDGTGVANVRIVDGALYATTGAGVYRVPGPLPTVADTTTGLQPVIPATDAVDSVFVDTDGAGGSDTAYVSRAERGLWKFVRTGDAWAQRGRVAGSFAWLTARAVAGAIEIYATNRANNRVVKVVDTAEAGAPLTSTGASTLAFAPSGVRYTGLAFTPGSGFAADATAYPAAPPTIHASTNTVDTHLQATPKASVGLDVSDPNTPASELTVTASSSNTTVLPNDRIVLAGTAERRVASFDPQATGTANVTFTVRAGDDQKSVTVSVRATGVAPHATSHYYSGLVDLSAALDVGDDHFLGISDEVNTVHLFKKGVSGAPLASFNQGFPGGESDFEGVARFGDTVVWTASHGNNRGGSARPERRFLAFTKITGAGAETDLEWAGSYTRLWQQWKDWDAANGHGLGANRLKFNTATVPGLVPNAPNGFNVEGLTAAPGGETTAWFGMRAPTITGDDGIERALILPVTNIEALTSDGVDAEFGAPILLDLGGRSIRDIAKNAADQYVITAGTGDTDDSLKNWALYTWDGNPSHDPVFVNELPTDNGAIGAWEGIADVPGQLGPGSRVLLTADSGDTNLGKSYGEYVTLGEPVQGPAVVTGVSAAAKPGAIDIDWDAAARADRYYLTVKTAAGAHAPGSPFFVTGTGKEVEGLTAGEEYTVTVRAENVATRSANSAAVKATPTQGARIATTTSLEFVGAKVAGEPQKLVATVSEPGARGIVRFFRGTTMLQDAVLREPIPGSDGFRAVQEFPVVDGKAEIDVTGQISVGIADLQARFTTSNPENFLSSDSAVAPTFIDYKPRVPRVEIVSITGARVAGSRIAIKVRLLGYTPAELNPGEDLPVELGTRLNGSNTLTRLDGGENSPENPSGEYGYAQFDADGEATFYTSALVAGKHRISGHVGNFHSGAAAAGTDEIPVTIAPAGSPAPEVPQIKRPEVFLTVSGSRIVNQPMTLTARVSDPALAGTVQFFRNNGTAIGTPVPVVDGVATYTGSPPLTLPQVFARFEPAADRDTTASAVSVAVPLMRLAVEPPFGPPTPTVTTLDVVGERTVGSPLTAKIAVDPAVPGPFAARDVNGYVELLDNGRVLGLAHVVAGNAQLELGVLSPGPHALQARYVTSDALRSEGSSASQTLDVVAQASGEVGGTVPATLALTLGAPASFGAFTPGVAREYTASTTATVVSTAGDAALDVSEPGHLANGAFTLAAPLEVSLSRSSWTQPVSNDTATIAFRQRIGADEALRTGRYGRTLTFTLSTTMP